MLNFQGLQGLSDLKQRAKESLKHSISEPLANGLFDFIYMILLNYDWNEKVCSKGIVFQDAIRDNLVKAVEGSLIANVNHFFAKGPRDPFKLLVKPNVEAWQGANLEGKCSCLAIILGIIESGEEYAGFTLLTGFTRSPPNAERFGQNDEVFKVDDLDVHMEGEASYVNESDSGNRRKRPRAGY